MKPQPHEPAQVNTEQSFVVQFLPTTGLVEFRDLLTFALDGIYFVNTPNR